MSGRREWDVLGIGDTDMDVFVKVAHIPGRDEKVFGEFLGEYPGGMIANFCCAASRLGVSAAMASVVGDDGRGAAALEGLAAYGVDTSQVRVRRGGTTFFCVIFLDGSGEKALTAIKTDCHIPHKTDIDAGAFGRATIVHTMGDDPELAAWAAREAKARGALVSLDMEAATTSHGLAALGDLLPNVDLAFINEVGLREGLGESPSEGAKRVLAAGPSVVAVTMGGDGSLVASREEAVQIPAFAVPVVDTTGAGDCFNGAFVVGYLRGWGLEACGRFASAAASLSVTDVGARGALPDEARVRALLAERSARVERA